MRAAIKWLGFALVAIAVAVLPFAIWISGEWGLISLTVGMVGAFLLVIGLGGSRPEPGSDDAPAEVPPGPAGEELRGFPGARVFRHDAAPSEGESNADSGR